MFDFDSSASGAERLRPQLKQALLEALHELDGRSLPLRRQYLRPPAAADFLGIDATTLANWRGKGCGPKYRKIGERVVYDVNDLVAFVEQAELLGSGLPHTAEIRNPS